MDGIYCVLLRMNYFCIVLGINVSVCVILGMLWLGVKFWLLVMNVFGGIIGI